MKKTIILFFYTIIPSILISQVSPLIQNNWQTFAWPYNAFYPVAVSGGVNGHVGNACGHTALARIMHYWGYPENGKGTLDFNDYFGNHWYIELDSMNLDYTSMPYILKYHDPQSVYEHTAKLFLACGALGERVEIGFTHGIMRITDTLQKYMNYSDQMYVAQRWDYSRNDWIDLFKNELDNGRPILIDGRTPSSPAPWEPGSWDGHFFVCDGYNSSEKFFTNYMYGGISGYFDIDSMGSFSAYHRAIINFEPKNVGIENPGTNNLEAKIFPNPANDFFFIDAETDECRDAEIIILSTEGRMVLRERLSGLELPFSVDCSAWSNGIYCLKFLFDDEVITKKMIINR